MGRWCACAGEEVGPAASGGVEVAGPDGKKTPDEEEMEK